MNSLRGCILRRSHRRRLARTLLEPDTGGSAASNRRAASGLMPESLNVSSASTRIADESRRHRRTLLAGLGARVRCSARR